MKVHGSNPYYTPKKQHINPKKTPKKTVYCPPWIKKTNLETEYESAFGCKGTHQKKCEIKLSNAKSCLNKRLKQQKNFAKKKGGKRENNIKKRHQHVIDLLENHISNCWCNDENFPPLNLNFSGIVYQTKP